MTISFTSDRSRLRKLLLQRTSRTSQSNLLPIRFQRFTNSFVRVQALLACALFIYRRLLPKVKHYPRNPRQIFRFFCHFDGYSSLYLPSVRRLNHRDLYHRELRRNKNEGTKNEIYLTRKFKIFFFFSAKRELEIQKADMPRIMTMANCNC